MARAVRIRSLAVSSGSQRSADQVERHLTRVAALRAYEVAEKIRKAMSVPDEA